MNVALTERALAALASAQPAVQKAFIKQINYLARDLHHPSLTRSTRGARRSGRRVLTTTGASISRSRAGRILSAASFPTRKIEALFVLFLILFQPRHLDGFQLSFRRTLRIVFEIFQLRDPLVQIGVADVSGVQIRELFV
jgi:hypothetical protein